MRDRSWRWLLLVLAPWIVAISRPLGLADVRDVRTWSYPDYTRVVVELSRPIEAAPELKRLGANPGAGRPERLYVDLPATWVGLRYDEGLPVKDGLLRGVRLGQNTRTTTRVVMDLERYDRHRMLVLRAPERLVIDLYGASRGDTRTLPVSLPGDRHLANRLPVGMRRIETVVVDAGHGGQDPGAIGVGSLREKDLNLAIAHRLAGALRDRGFRVVLTRSGDTTLSLEERTALAESVSGDLFISIHANASPHRTTRGFEVYYLDASHERHSLRVAARENGVNRADMDSLQRTLAMLRTSEVSSYAGRLAERVHAAMGMLFARHRGYADLGVKKGPFYVLFLSSMPAILVETAFVSNASDADLLRDLRFQQAMADQIAGGVSAYRDQSPSFVTGAGG